MKEHCSDKSGKENVIVSIILIYNINNSFTLWEAEFHNESEDEDDKK